MYRDGIGMVIIGHRSSKSTFGANTNKQSLSSLSSMVCEKILLNFERDLADSLNLIGSY